MRKILLAFSLVLATAYVQAQEYNMFATSDVDENGWLWFDTQEKVDKYVGVCNEDDYKVDPNGKPIQLVYADQNPTYPETTVDPTIIGFGAEGEVGAEGFKTGAIVLPAASAVQSTNGGGFAILMPSCSTFSINLSSDSRVLCQIMSTTDANTVFGQYEVRKAYSLFNKFAGAGNTTKTGLESLTNGYNDITIKSDNPVYVYFRNINNSEIYIHGIKVTTPKQNTNGINDITYNGDAETALYTIDGVKVTSPKSGVYIMHCGKSTKKYIVK